MAAIGSVLVWTMLAFKCSRVSTSDTASTASSNSAIGICRGVFVGGGDAIMAARRPLVPLLPPVAAPPGDGSSPEEVPTTF